MTWSTNHRGRLRIYAAVLIANAVVAFMLPFVFDSEYDPGFSEGLATSAWVTLLVATSCTVAEVLTRLYRRRWQRRHGDLAAPPFKGPSGWRRLAIYTLGLPVVVWMGMMIGGATYDCPVDAADCDLGVGNVLAGGVLALGAGVVTIAAGEITAALWRRNNP